MAVAYASHNTAGAASGNLTITKPTGLATGDMMIVALSTHDVGSAWSASGWTNLATQVNSTTWAATVLWKIADSSDVAASNFTFTNPGNECIGILLRFTGASFTGSANMNVGSSKDVVGSTTPTHTGTTVNSTSDLLISIGIAPILLTSFTSNAVANNNPSWTERADFQNNQTEDASIVVATATPTAAGSTGNHTFTIANSTESVGVLINLAETASVTVSPSVVTMTSSVQSPSVAGGANVSPAVVSITSAVQAPVVATALPKFSNTDKSATSTFTNPDKS